MFRLLILQTSCIPAVLSHGGIITKSKDATYLVLVKNALVKCVNFNHKNSFTSFHVAEELVVQQVKVSLGYLEVYLQTTPTSVTTEDLLVHNGGDGQAVETVRERLPELDVVASPA